MAATIRGIAVGDSQLKFMARHRVPLGSTVEFVTFSFCGSTTETLPELIAGLRLQPVDFVAIYVGGNDLFKLRPNNTPATISERVENLVRSVQEWARQVLVYRIIPRGDQLGSAKEADRLHLNRLLVRRLAPLGVTVLNVDHLFLTGTHKPNHTMLAVDSYHVCRVRGVQALAFVLSRAVCRSFGTVHRGRVSVPIERFRVAVCYACSSKGHEDGSCESFRVLPS